MLQFRESRLQFVEALAVVRVQLLHHVPEGGVSVGLRTQGASAAILGREQARHPCLHRRPLARGSLDRFDDEVRIARQQLLRREVPVRHQQIRHLGPDRLRRALPSGELAFVIATLGGRRDREAVVVIDVREERLQTVIVLLPDRVELVVVAARALKRQAEKRRPDDLRDVVQGLLASQEEILLVALFGIVPIEGGRDTGFGTAWPQFVPRELLLHEAVVRLVSIERVDHVIAVAPSVRTGHVLLESVAFREASQVQPVPSPALSVMRGRQQALDDALVGIRRRIVQKRFHLDRIGRQADQIEVDPAQ